jgi:hypothetical protein
VGKSCRNDGLQTKKATGEKNTGEKKAAAKKKPAAKKGDRLTDRKNRRRKKATD